MNTPKLYIPVYKTDIAEAYGMHPRTFCKLLNVTHYTEFAKLGYSKCNRMLTPKQRELVRELIGDPEFDIKNR